MPDVFPARTTDVRRDQVVEHLKQVDAVAKEFGDPRHLQADRVDALVSRLLRAVEASGLKGLPGEVFTTRELVQIVLAGDAELDDGNGR